MEKSNPFYKERVLSPLQNKSKTLKLSSEVLKEYEKHFKDKYPEYIKKDGSLNDNKIITKLLLDYLNTQCLERKEFNIDVLIAISKSKPLKPVILAVRDDYTINKYDKKYNNTQFIRLNQEKFNEARIFLNLNELYEEYFKQKYFTKHKFNEKAYKNYEKFETIITTQILIEAEHYDYNYILFRVNNYLDEFQNGVYATPADPEGLAKPIYARHKVTNYLKGSPPEPIIHKGIGKAEEYYFTYEWSYYPNTINSERLILDSTNFEVISKDKFNSLIKESSNSKIKDYLTKTKTETNQTTTKIKLEDKNKRLKEQLYELMKNKRIEEERISKFYETKLKNYEELIKKLIEEQNNNKNEIKELKNIFKKDKSEN